jgi:hypothetical protein
VQELSEEELLLGRIALGKNCLGKNSPGRPDNIRLRPLQDVLRRPGTFACSLFNLAVFSIIRPLCLKANPVQLAITTRYSFEPRNFIREFSSNN